MSWLQSTVGNSALTSQLLGGPVCSEEYPEGELSQDGGGMSTIPDLTDGVCMAPESKGGGGTPPAAPTGPLTMEEYTRRLGDAEARYRAERTANMSLWEQYVSKPDLGAEFSAGMRKLYGYGSDQPNWKLMLQDAPDSPNLDFQKYPELAGLFDASTDANGKTTYSGKEVVLPNGEKLDPGHLYTGIDAVRFPDANWRMDGYGIQNRDGATWAGDVGSAMVDYKNNKTTKTADQSFNDLSGPGDLNADLDGINIGSGWDKNKTVTDNLKSYYLDKGATNTYTRRYSEFAKNRGLGLTDDNKLNTASEDEIRKQSDNFAEAYSRRGNGFWSKVGGGVGFNNFDPKDDNSKPMTDRFIKYVNDGLAGEPKP